MTPKQIDKMVRKARVQMYSQLDSGKLRELLLLSKAYKNYAMDKIDKRMKDLEESSSLEQEVKEDLVYLLSENVSDTQEISKIGEELAIIGLYKSQEIAIKIAAKASGLFSDKQIDEFYCTKKFNKHLKSIGIDVTLIADFKKFNELKLLNNCLKHSGIVDKKLAIARPERWKEGRVITDVTKDFDYLIVPSINFVREFGYQLRKKI